MSNGCLIMMFLFISISICNYQESTLAKFVLEHLVNKIYPSNTITLMDLDDLIQPNDTICKGRIIKLFKENIRDPLFRPFLEFTGKGIQQYGDYHSCQNSNNMSYFVISIIMPPIPMPVGSIGACFPSVCNSLTLPQALQDYFNKILGLFSSKQLMLFAVEPKSFNAMLKDNSNGSYICILILIIYLLIIFIATARKYYTVWLCDKNRKQNDSQAMIILDCFNLKDNIEGLMKNENRIDPKLNIFQFVRCLIMLWIVVAHCFIFPLFSFTPNMQEALTEVMFNKGMAILKSGFIAVDVFFMFSGFLSTMAIVSIFEKEQNRSIKNLLLLYFHRYARLFPLMFICWAFSSFLLPLGSHGVNTTSIQMVQQQCRSRFWQTFLYIDNYFVTLTGFCNSWIWYLFVDLQLFIVTPFIVFPAMKNNILGILILIVLSLCSYGLQFFILESEKMSASTFNPHPNFNEHYYQQPYNRCNTYLLGIFFAYLYFQFKGHKLFQLSLLKCINQIFKYRAIRYFISLSGVILIIYLIFLINYFDHTFTPIPQYHHTLYFLFTRVLFCLGVMFILYPAIVCFSRPLCSFLTSPFFNFMGKITFGTYMLHLLIIAYFQAITINGFYYSFYPFFVQSVSLYFFCYLVSFIFTILFESPVVQLLKLLTLSQRRSALSEVKPKLKDE